MKGIAALLLLAFLPAPLVAQVRMCKDAQGRKVFSDVPCGPDATTVDVRPAAGGPVINPGATLQVQHYPIRGTTWARLEREIGSKGPEGWWGVANTQIGFEVQTRPTGGGCAVRSAHATSNARVRLPEWVNRFEGSRNLQVYWDGVYRSLDLHERGHVQISVEGAKEMERTLNEIPEQSTCEAVTAEAHRRAQRVWSLVQRRQMAYDAETDHGRRQWSPYRD